MADPAAQLAPTGKLRVAIAIAPRLGAIRHQGRGRHIAASPSFWASSGQEARRSGRTGRPQRLRRNPKFGSRQQMGRGLPAGRRGAQEIRRLRQRLSPAAEHLSGRTLAKIASVAADNAAGVRIGGVANTATFRTSNKTAPNATHCQLRQDRRRAGGAAWRGGGRAGVLARIGSPGWPESAGSRILDGGFLNSTTSVAVPKGRPEALAYVTDSSRKPKPPAWCTKPSMRWG